LNPRLNCKAMLKCEANTESVFHICVLLQELPSMAITGKTLQHEFIATGYCALDLKVFLSQLTSKHAFTLWFATSTSFSSPVRLQQRVNNFLSLATQDTCNGLVMEGRCKGMSRIRLPATFIKTSIDHSISSNAHNYIKILFLLNLSKVDKSWRNIDKCKHRRNYEKLLYINTFARFRTSSHKRRR